ncbi:MAG: AAA family ATPase [Bacteroidales bacterium]|nr:AAA family ATPase [Bacteroidales bacterium]
MLQDHIIQLIRQNLPHDPTPGQSVLIDSLADFVFSIGIRKALIVKGYAGTGKTSVIGALVKTLDEAGIKTVLLAPTGRAAKVFSGYAQKIAYTIHRKIYIQKSSKDGFGIFILGKNLHTNTLFLVDEASMISNSKSEDSVFGTGRVLDDLIHYVKAGTNCKLIFIGDTAQLPPVGILLSPALEKNKISVYYPDSDEYTLMEVVRQAQNSGILVNATLIRNQINTGHHAIPVLKHRNLPDVHVIYGNELPEAIEKAYEHFGIEDTIVVCRSNKRANQYNSGIRKQVLYREEELAAGDLLMVVKNNYYWLNGRPEIEFIANGDIVRVLKIMKHVDRYGFHFCYVTLQLIDYHIEFESWILLDTLTAESPSLPDEGNRRLFNCILEDFEYVKSKRKQYSMVREDQFFNALQVKFAYAVTCHKAQGGQWKAVFIDQGFIKQEAIDREYLRWLYTAITRATDDLYLVNFPDYCLEGP